MKQNTQQEAPLNWFILKQAALETRIGEPIFITLQIVYDGYVEVKLMTPDGVYGFSEGWSLQEAVMVAGEMLVASYEYQASQQKEENHP